MYFPFSIFLHRSCPEKKMSISFFSLFVMSFLGQLCSFYRSYLFIISFWTLYVLLCRVISLTSWQVWLHFVFFIVLLSFCHACRWLTRFICFSLLCFLFCLYLRRCLNLTLSSQLIIWSFVFQVVYFHSVL